MNSCPLRFYHTVRPAEPLELRRLCTLYMLGRPTLGSRPIPACWRCRRPRTRRRTATCGGPAPRTGRSQSGSRSACRCRASSETSRTCSRDRGSECWGCPTESATEIRNRDRVVEFSCTSIILCKHLLVFLLRYNTAM